jgi:hypothetical protein
VGFDPLFVERGFRSAGVSQRHGFRSRVSTRCESFDSRDVADLDPWVSTRYLWSADFDPLEFRSDMDFDPGFRLDVRVSTPAMSRISIRGFRPVICGARISIRLSFDPCNDMDFDPGFRLTCRVSTRALSRVSTGGGGGGGGEGFNGCHGHRFRSAEFQPESDTDAIVVASSCGWFVYVAVGSICGSFPAKPDSILATSIQSSICSAQL